MPNPRRPIALVCLVLLCATPSFGQRSKSSAQRNPRASLTPQEIAALAMPSVFFVQTEDRNAKPLALGSGFLVEDLAVLTNYHVVRGAARVRVSSVKGSDSTQNGAQVIFSDESRDLALLLLEKRVQGRPLEIAETLPKVASPIFALGNPEGLGGTFSSGIVSGFRGIGNNGLYMQITAPISHGSSGGPILNDQGKVVGLAVASLEEGQNLNFAIPCTMLRAFLREEASTSRIARILEGGKGDQPRGPSDKERQGRRPDYSELIAALLNHAKKCEGFAADFNGQMRANINSDRDFEIANHLQDSAFSAGEYVGSVRGLMTVYQLMSILEERQQASSVIKDEVRFYLGSLSQLVTSVNGDLGRTRSQGIAALASRFLGELRECQALLESVTYR
jgi:hypothetical protein